MEAAYDLLIGARMGSPTNRIRLTKGYIDRVRPGPKDEFHWDTEVRGFGLRVNPSGRITFIVQGRVDGATHSARLTIGAYGVFTLDQARDAARENLRTMRMGRDPRALRREEAALRITLREVAEIYITRPGMLKETTKAEMKQHVELMWGEFLDKPIASIAPSDVRRRYDEVATEGMRGHGPAPVRAVMATVTLRTLINFARTEYTTPEGRPLIEYNPVSILKKELKPSPPRTRHIERRRVGEFWDFLCRLRQIPWNGDAQTSTELVMFLLLTGARRNEGAMLTWDGSTSTTTIRPIAGGIYLTPRTDTLSGYPFHPKLRQF